MSPAVKRKRRQQKRPELPPSLQTTVKKVKRKQKTPTRRLTVKDLEDAIADGVSFDENSQQLMPEDIMASQSLPDDVMASQSLLDQL